MTCNVRVLSAIVLGLAAESLFAAPLAQGQTAGARVFWNVEEGEAVGQPANPALRGGGSRRAEPAELQAEGKFVPKQLIGRPKGDSAGVDVSPWTVTHSDKGTPSNEGNVDIELQAE